MSKALGNRRGINRAGYFVMPMDETLAVAAIDLGGRPHAVVDLQVKVVRVGDLQTELVHDFFEGFAIGARANVHVKVLYGRSSHHKIEAVFKAFARALRVACAKDRAARADAAEHQGAAVIALIDYKAGNLTSVKKALATIGAAVFVPATPEELADGERRHRAGRRPLRRDAGAGRRVDRGDPRARRRRTAAARHLPRACSGCTKAATKRPTVPGPRRCSSRRSCYRRSSGDGRLRRTVTSRSRTSAGTASRFSGEASIVDGVPTERAGLLHAQLRRRR